jgi:hypothetical protein
MLQMSANVGKITHRKVMVCATHSSTSGACLVRGGFSSVFAQALCLFILPFELLDVFIRCVRQGCGDS